MLLVKSPSRDCVPRNSVSTWITRFRICLRISDNCGLVPVIPSGISMSASGWVNGFDPVDERPDMMESVAFKRNAPLPCKSPSGPAGTKKSVKSVGLLGSLVLGPAGERTTTIMDDIE